MAMKVGIVLFSAVIMLGSLLALLHPRMSAVYKKPIDDSFLGYFEAGSSYTPVQFSRRVFIESNETIALNQEKLLMWLEGCVVRGVLKERQELRIGFSKNAWGKMKGCKVLVYSLPEKAP